MKTLLSILFLTTITVTASSSVSALEPQRLRCEYLENPTGIDAARPRLSWQVTSDQRGQSDAVNAYLFAIPEGLTVGKLRFDPFATYDEYANAGEMKIESISIYRLVD
ncbi:glycoside hydrolase family 78 protein [Rhodopirellula sp. P2]|uniref:glycoside hydrolase family 78 protein n=1 Tax=Rhodopirellula sp. P2 TaxID=2127060 RepID=UPI002368A8A9|nr:hypothetical protein [Rhodopirellula sp. P2]WDQ16305.1 hypothetical protein PSR62_22155 [Rhodopirellula sp. P2]